MSSKPSAISALGSVIDVLMKSASLPFRTSSRTGPVCELVPASASVWQPPQPLLAKTALPSAAGAAPSPAGFSPPSSPAGASPPPAGAFCLRQPGIERGGCDDLRRRAHDGVPEPAQLGADDRIRAKAARRDAVVRREARHRVDLHAKRRDPEVVQDVARLDREAHRAVLGEVERRRLDRLLALGLGVLVGPGELLARDGDDHLVGLRLLDVDAARRSCTCTARRA